MTSLLSLTSQIFFIFLFFKGILFYNFTAYIFACWRIRCLTSQNYDCYQSVSDPFKTLFIIFVLYSLSFFLIFEILHIFLTHTQVFIFFSREDVVHSLLMLLVVEYLLRSNHIKLGRLISMK